MDLARHLRHVALKTAGMPFGRRYDFLLDESWTPRFLAQYRKARRCWNEMQGRDVRMVRVFSYSRSGTHNFFSRFHYMPACFVLQENLFETPGDRHQLAATVESVRPIDLMGLSVFGPYGLQDKRGRDVSRIVLPSNRFLEYPCTFDPAALERDFVVFYVRNFLRMLYSRQQAAEKMDKPAFAVTDDVFANWARRHLENLRQIARLTAKCPERFQLVLHESFCARPDEVLANTAALIRIPPEQVACWRNVGRFFREGFYRAGAPTVENDQLWERRPGGGRRRIGGNKYNPVPPPSLERTMSDPVAAWMTAGRRRMACDVFGAELVDLWMNDTAATYAAGDAEVRVAMERAVRP